VAAQAADPDSILGTYRTLTNLRASHPALGHGTWIDVESSESSVLAFIRHLPEETLLVASNLSAEPATVALSLEDGPLCGTLAAEVILGSPTPEPPTVTPSGGFDAYAPVPEIEPRETVVIRLSAR
jgi:maltose alpha-D-glucosyltransferase/alpha-amylase